MEILKSQAVSGVRPQRRIKHWHILSKYVTLYRPSDRRVPAKLVPTLADRGCRVVSATNPHGRNLGFLDPELLLFHSSSSSV
jgi:hypothetical protein